MHLCNTCLRKGNSGGLSHQNMTAQPHSVFFHSNTMSVLLRLPLSADICNALCMVTHHWKDAKPWVDVIASLISHHTSIWSSKHVFCLITSVTNPPFNCNSWCLKINSHEGWWGILSCITCCSFLPEHAHWISWAHQNFKTHTHTDTPRQCVKALTCHNSEPGSQLQIRHQLWVSNRKPCRIPGADVFHRGPSPHFGTQLSVLSIHEWVAAWCGKSTAFSMESVALCKG